jgi:tetratricopeptide (TPR) repeat protein
MTRANPRSEKLARKLDGEDWDLFRFFQTVTFAGDEDRPQTPVLVIEQFEELFCLYPPAQRRQIVRDLGDLITRKFPVDPGSETRDFQRDAPRVKLLLTISQEHLGALDEFRNVLPDVVAYRVPVRPLTREQARQALINPGPVELGPEATEPFELDREVADPLLTLARIGSPSPGDGDRARYDNFLLQLLGRYIERWLGSNAQALHEDGQDADHPPAPDADAVPSDAETLAEDAAAETALALDVDNVRANLRALLFRYYEMRLKELPRGRKRKRCRLMLESSLFGELSRHKGITARVAELQFGVTQSLLNAMTRHHLLREKVGKQGFEYVLIHDSLTPAIREMRNRLARKRLQLRGVLFALFLAAISLVVNLAPPQELAMPTGSATSVDISLERYSHDPGLLENYLRFKSRGDEPESLGPLWQLSALLEEQGRYLEALETVFRIQKMEGETLPVLRRKLLLFERLEKDARVLEVLNSIEDHMRNHKGDMGDDGFAPEAWADLYYRRGLAHGTRGDVVSAEDDLQRSLHHYRRAPEEELTLNRRAAIHTELGDLMLAQGLPREAAEHFEQALTLRPALPVALSGRARALRELENVTAALADLDRVIAAEPGNLGAIRARVEALLELGRPEEASRDLERLLRQYPGNPTLLLSHARVLQRMDRDSEAFDIFTRVLERDPDNVAALMERAQIALQRNDPRGAYRDYTDVIEIDPNIPKAYGNRGIINRRLGDLEGALSDYSRLIMLNPDDPKAHYLRGNVYLDQGNFAKAAEDFSAATRLDPQNARAWNNLGYAHIQLEEFEQAIQDFTRAIELDPVNAEAYSNRGFAIYYHNQDATALADFHRSIILNPRNPENFINRGNYYLEIEDPELAVKDFTQAIELDESAAEAYRGRALAYEKLRMAEEAQADAEQYEQLTES